MFIHIRRGIGGKIKQIKAGRFLQITKSVCYEFVRCSYLPLSAALLCLYYSLFDSSPPWSNTQTHTQLKSVL